MPESPVTTVMTASEVAEALRISKATVSRMARRGTLRALDMPGRLLFARTAVDRFLERPRNVGTPR